MAYQFHFVGAPEPTGRASKGTRKTNHSHVMRQVHAKKRRARTQRYQNAVRNTRSGMGAKPPEMLPSRSQIQTFGHSRDPFSSLARPLSSEEHFLLHQCMFQETLLKSLTLFTFLFKSWHKLPIFSSLRNQSVYYMIISNLILDIQVVMPHHIGHCKLFTTKGDHYKQMLQEWVALAVADDAFMTVAILLSTCRYMLRIQPSDPFFTQMALRYKETCLHRLRSEIERNSSFVSVMSVAKALALAIDGVRKATT